MGEVQSPTRKLDRWVQEIVKFCKDTDVKDFNKSWSDGVAFCALVHYFKPDLISWEIVTRTKPFVNCQLAFGATERLGIPPVMDVADMSLTDPDPLCIITYLVQLWQYFGDANHVPLDSVYWEKDVFGQGSLLRLLQIGIERDQCEGQNQMSDPPCRSKEEVNVCSRCKETVYVLERLFVDGKLFHRHCFLCQFCKATLKIGLFRHAHHQEGYECLMHEKDHIGALMVETISSDHKKDLKSASDPESGATDSTSAIVSTIDVTGSKVDLNCPEIVLHEEEAKSDMGANDSGVSENLDETSSPAQSCSPGDNGGSGGAAARAAESVPSELKNKPVPPPRRNRRSVTPSGCSSNESIPLSATTSGSFSSLPHSKTSTPVPAQRPPQPAVRKSKLVPVAGDPDEKLYPDDLNPFGDDDEEEGEGKDRHKNSVSGEVSAKPISDSAQNTCITNRDASKPQNDYLKSLNPFGSSDSESDSEVDKSDTESGRHSFEDSKVQGLWINTAQDTATGNRHSVCLGERKKRPAPKPPMETPASTARSHGKKRPAPPRPLPEKREAIMEQIMLAEEIDTQLAMLDEKQSILEQNARTVESKIRELFSEGFGPYSESCIESFEKWFAMVRKRTELIRSETQLVYKRREHCLNDLHTEIEYKYRCLMEKPESEKRVPDDYQMEEFLLNRLLEVIEDKNALVEALDHEQQQKRTDSATLMSQDVDHEKREKDKKEHKKKRLRLKKVRRKLRGGKKEPKSKAGAGDGAKEK